MGRPARGVLSGPSDVNQRPLLLLTILALVACGIERFEGLDHLPANEAVAFARLRLLHNGEDVTNGAVVVIDRPMNGVPRFQYKLDRDGLLFARLPLGRHSIDEVQTPSGLAIHDFRRDELAFEVKGAGAVYYLGDVTMDWRGMGSGAAFALVAAGTITAGLAGGAAAGLATKGTIIVSVDVDTPAAHAAFARRFPIDRDLVPTPLAVRPSASGS